MSQAEFSIILFFNIPQINIQRATWERENIEKISIGEKGKFMAEKHSRNSSCISESF